VLLLLLLQLIRTHKNLSMFSFGINSLVHDD
jgi:hypothetical protein